MSVKALRIAPCGSAAFPRSCHIIRQSARSFCEFRVPFCLRMWPGAIHDPFCRQACKVLVCSTGALVFVRKSSSDRSMRLCRIPAILPHHSTIGPLILRISRAFLSQDVARCNTRSLLQASLQSARVQHRSFYGILTPGAFAVNRGRSLLFEPYFIIIKIRGSVLSHPRRKIRHFSYP